MKNVGGVRKKVSFQFSFEARVQGRADALGVRSRQQMKQSRILADLSSWFSSGGLTETIHRRRHHHLNVHFLPCLIMGNGYGWLLPNSISKQPTSMLEFLFSHSDASIFEKIPFSHHQAVVYPWECWNKYLVVRCLS